MPRRPVQSVLLLAVLFLAQPADTLAEDHRLAVVPAVANVEVNGQEAGSLHYLVIQLDVEPQRRGPVIQFLERSHSTAVSDDWKEGARLAVLAAADLVGEDPKGWLLTIKNTSHLSFVRGTSASSALAVGIVAAAKGEALQLDMALTGQLLPDGRIGAVGGLAGKLEGAATAHIQTLLIPRGQGRTADSDLFEQGRQRNVRVVEVGSLREAYELMTGKRRR